MTHQDLYHRLPYSLKCAAASFRGRRLNAWRYGSDTDRLVAEALERESWSTGDWETYQRRELSGVLESAVERVPFYRESMASHAGPLDVLSGWPVLDKESLRAAPERFLRDDANPRKLFQLQTSGTTGKPVRLWRDRATSLRWHALFEARWRRWYGVDRFDNWAILGGQLVTSVKNTRPPFWVWNAAGRQLYLSVYHLSKDNLGHYLKALRDHRVVYLWGYSSALATLAAAVLNGAGPAPQIKVVIANAEPLLEAQRTVLEAAFGCPVRETYGMTEAVIGASECDQGTLHLWPDAGCYEILQSDGSAARSGSGPLIATGLLNTTMPLIRYRVGDEVSMAVPDAKCPCGRSLPMLIGVEGRSDDMVVLRDGRRVGRLDPVFKGNMPVQEAQIVQKEFNRFVVVLVPANGFGDATRTEIERRLRERVGDVLISFEVVDQIPRGRNGKFKAVISEVRDV